MRRRREWWLLLALFSGAAAAQDAAGDLAALQPTGPVTVTADRGEWVQGGPMRYTGNVALRSDTLSLDGDLLELRQLGDGRFEARISGTPARLDHAGEAAGDSTDSAAPAVKAQARELFYDSQAGVVELTGGAQLMRGSDEINGDRIRYDVAARRVQADGGSGGQVKIVIQPPPHSDVGAEPKTP